MSVHDHQPVQCVGGRKSSETYKLLLSGQNFLAQLPEHIKGTVHVYQENSDRQYVDANGKQLKDEEMYKLIAKIEQAEVRHCPPQM